ncbi:glycoside hydrolase family 25 protein [Altererythrobacter sp. CC-YST694]|uniref:glycoside hydrolase family 25 protein n=1 Tax=Altererythrobacter sp. CC-YST694 TaxID=2755038 RepID=UPI001D00859E|nr:glycoside hydrolase family 25 protein [Altererythrobacter sp. CC-YST694]MCB5425726.1 glycoside hydrolase family 25 protein [Altererythrobacter sp. CC-YST694]
MGRKKRFPTRWRVMAALLLAALLGGAWQWWEFIHWTPQREAYPVQGILVSAEDGRTSFAAFKAIGADFAYLEASSGAVRRDPAFARNLAAVRAAGLQFGAVHHYDPCIPADRQAANFVTVVPRDDKLLPPAIELDETADECEKPVSDQAVESELMTFLNQVEGHAGKPALLKISEEFERRYRLATAIDRNLWLTRDRFEPDYAGRPWTLWTANSALRSEASPAPVRWVVVQP